MKHPIYEKGSADVSNDEATQAPIGSFLGKPQIRGGSSLRRYTAAVIGCSRMGAFIDNEVADSNPSSLPYSHAAGYESVERIDLIACSDLRTDVMAKFGERYGVPSERQYTDYKELILKERPDIVSIATQPEHRAEIAVFACENGVKALYCEKALCASLEEADRIAQAVQRHGVVFNMGTNRRWDVGFDAMKALIDSGDLGALQSIIIYANGTLFNTSSHTFDLAMRLNDDVPAEWVQAFLPRGDELIDGDTVTDDPSAQATIQFANGVIAYALLTRRASEYEAICERGTITALNNGSGWQLRRINNSGNRRGRLEDDVYPAPPPQSSTKRLIEDLVHALDTGAPTRGGVQVARANQELIMACIESHRRGGARVQLPLIGSTLRLHRAGRKAREPRYAV